MSNGILERIEAMLVILVARETSADFATEIVGTLAETSEHNKALAETAVGVEVDKNFTPWDERIHTSNKGKTQKGIWKRKPGIDDELFDTVMKEIYVPTNEEKLPNKKLPPSKPGKKSPPSKPGKKSPPSKPAKADENKFKGQALKNISVITEKFGAKGEHVVEALLVEHEVDTFDALPKELHSSVYDETVQWLKDLDLVQNEVDVLTTLSKNTEHADDITEGISGYISESGGDASDLGSVPRVQLAGLLKELTEYADSWEEFFKEE